MTPYILTQILLPIASLFMVFLTGIGAFRLGKFLIRGRVTLNSFTLNFVFNTSIGLMALSYAVFFLNCIHCVNELSLWFLAGFFIALAVFELLEWYLIREWFLSRLRSDRHLLVFLFVYGFFMLLCASLPPYSRDELIYHLEIPKRILENGGQTFFQDNIYAYFPSLGEMLFTLGLGTLGETAARLFHTLYGLLLALALFGFSKRRLAAEHAFAACALFLTSPVVFTIFPIAYVDLAYSLYAFLAFTFLLEYLKEADSSFIFASALMVGCAVAVKYTGIQYLILMLCVCLLVYLIRGIRRKKVEEEGRRSNIPLTPFSSVFFLLIPFIITSPYFIRNWIVTGWPLFPFPTFHWPLKPGIHWSLPQAEMYLIWLSHFGTSLGAHPFVSTLLAPILVFVRGQFNAPEFYEGVIGPVFLLSFAAMAMIVRDRSTQSKTREGVTADQSLVTLFVILFLYYWAMTTKQARFLVPVLPWLSFLIAYGLGKYRHPFFYVIVCLGVSWNLFVGVKEFAGLHPMRYWLGKETREDFLSREIAVYSAYQKANQALDSRSKLFLINMKNYGYYINTPWAADFIFERYRVDQTLKPASGKEDLEKFFREQNITHLLMDWQHLNSSEWGMVEPYKTAFLQFLKQKTDVVLEEGPYLLVKLKHRA